ncbi:MAG: hypothetical protein HONBIEJF_00409 [Fimbriimonadaceae bacterium]|nr:hypothetical protein [Fimbriimonadaceae bacterium]
MLATALAICLMPEPGPMFELGIVRLGNRSVAARTLRLRWADYAVDVAWPRTGLGTTAAMAAIAKQAGADIAVNGCFFDAYLQSPRKNPNQNLVANGRVAYIGGTGCTFGFSETLGPRIDRVRFKLLGTISRKLGAQSSWYAYRVNHTPQNGNIAGIFDQSHGSKVDGTGMKVVVSGGKVEEITYGEARIPRNGYVVFLGSGESSLQRRFQVGDTLEYKLDITGGDPEFWRQVATGVGGGPKLLSQGRVDLHAEDEGFRDPKILTGSNHRSMIGWTKGGEIVIALATCRMSEGAKIMQKLGCWEAMNLDGGASSGLWVREKGYLHTPGRPLSNLLIFKKR